MRGRAGTARRGSTIVVALLLSAAPTACSGTSRDGASAVRPADTTNATGTSVHSGGTIGARGSVCELPVTFDIAEDWKAEAVDPAAAGDSPAGEEVADALLRQGPVTTVCEVDAKPAGNIGFLRVFTGPPGAGDASTVLRAFVAAEEDVSEETYRSFTTGGLEGVEVEYARTSELLDEPKKERALAVGTAQGPVVLHLGGMDTEEHEQMLCAYELARRTLRNA
ncbi:lipoprotein [Streptomyces sp. NPDC020792]|uniref:lipoprotein n=1 Tax=Streptomyces sp. NPDC020792 TaxID=3365089 RepID=UPI003787C17F